MRFLILTLLVGIVLLLTGCASDPGKQDGPGDFPGQHTPVTIPDATPRAEPLSRYGNPKHYEVYGKRYYVQKSSKDFRPHGIASWYGKQFHGRRTSSGETYDMYEMTAAHKTLPLPTYVKVTSQRNGRSIVVRVNDRGPFHSKRIIDLSYAAAVKLGIANSGTAPVSIEAINTDTKPKSQQDLFTQQNVSPIPNHQTTSQGQFVQLGVFAELDNAKRLQNKFLHSSLPTPEIITVTINDADLYRVLIGPIDSDDQIQSVSYQLEKMGIQYRHILAP
jgi:rare lipoprotein A